MKRRSIKKILAVDDDPVSLTFVAKHLRKAGFEVETAENGKDALDKLQQHTNAFSVVVSDQLMPIMSGTKLTQKISNDATLCHIPVIMLTRLGDIKDAINAVNKGVFEYITKPANPKELVDLVSLATNKDFF